MTLVCAYTDGKHTWLGCDTYSVASIGTVTFPTEGAQKWIIHQDGVERWGFGQVGDALVGVMMEQHAERLFSNLSTFSNPPWEFRGRLVRLFEEHGIERAHENGDAVRGWQNSGILACPGQIWDFDSVLTPTAQRARQVYCRGSAMPLALGAAWGYQRANPNASPEVLIDTALDAGIRFDMQIRGKWTGRLVAP